MVVKQSISIQPIPKHHRVGILHVEAGRRLHEHEMVTLTKLLRFGEDIFYQTESHYPGSKTADIIWKDEKWEIKYVKGKSNNTLKHSIEKARKQSSQIVLDLSSYSVSIQRSLGKIKQLMKYNKEILKILIVSKESYCMITRDMLK